MVNVLVVADEVAPELDARRLRRIAPDLVLSAGDLPWDYLEFLASAVDAPLVFVPGNHDSAIPHGSDHHDRGPLGAINADVNVVEAAGLKIAGLGGCVRYRDTGPHQYTQQQYVWRARRLMWRARFAGPVDVLLTHAPPRGLGDGEDRPHVGIEALHPTLARLQPAWHLHGHIHPFGQEMPDRQVGPTTVRNVIPWTTLQVGARSATSLRQRA
ncbi:MAG: metallophosphoesterase [Marmoricola sp.]